MKKYRQLDNEVISTRVEKQTTISKFHKAGRRVAASALFYSGALSLLRTDRYERLVHVARERDRDFPFIVLLYHRVNPDNDPFFPAISVETFDAQIRVLTAHFQVLPLAEIINRKRQGLGVAPGTVAVTFDDGYRDNYLYAHPILKKYNCPATLFTATNYIDTEKLMWNDKLALAIKFATHKSIAIPGSTRSISLVSVAERIIALEHILETLKSLSEPDKLTLADEIFRRLYNKQPKCEPLMLSWNELKQMAYNGWDVGSHTANHVILTRVPLCQGKEEINSSGHILERELGRPIRLFAYPNGKPGDYDPLIKQFLRNCGYIGAFTTVDGVNAHDTDLFEIGRKSPWEECLPGFALRISRSFWR
jgi:peptidoglycan/xylan/chitin deacetylase (PgdA/CDA1 family)